MDRVLFVDGASHTKTKSGDFLVSLLSRHFEVETFYIDEADRDRIIDKGRQEFAAVVFFQINPAFYINHFNGQNVVFVPMYDTFSVLERRHLLFLKKVKWICFSEKFRPIIDGIDSLFVKYYPEVRFSEQEARPGSFFFWHRRPEVDWTKVKKLLGSFPVEAVNIHSACDSGTSFVEPDSDDRERYGITVTSWFDSKDELERLMTKYRYYFAPRGIEGIGMSFLDAMALGMVVIAPNEATMNEYIVDGVNGYLYDLDDPKPINFGDYARIRERSVRQAIEGRRAWEASEGEIIDFIKMKPKRIAYFMNKSQLVKAWDVVKSVARR